MSKKIIDYYMKFYYDLPTSRLMRQIRGGTLTSASQSKSGDTLILTSDQAPGREIKIGPNEDITKLQTLPDGAIRDVMSLLEEPDATEETINELEKEGYGKLRANVLDLYTDPNLKQKFKAQEEAVGKRIAEIRTQQKEKSSKISKDVEESIKGLETKLAKRQEAKRKREEEAKRKRKAEEAERQRLQLLLAKEEAEEADRQRKAQEAKKAQQVPAGDRGRSTEIGSSSRQRTRSVSVSRYDTNIQENSKLILTKSKEDIEQIPDENYENDVDDYIKKEIYDKIGKQDSKYIFNKIEGIITRILYDVGTRSFRRKEKNILLKKYANVGNQLLAKGRESYDSGFNYLQEWDLIPIDGNSDNLSIIYKIPSKRVSDTSKFSEWETATSTNIKTINKKLSEFYNDNNPVKIIKYGIPKLDNILKPLRSFKESEIEGKMGWIIPNHLTTAFDECNKIKGELDKDDNDYIKLRRILYNDDDNVNNVMLDKIVKWGTEFKDTQGNLYFNKNNKYNKDGTINIRSVETQRSDNAGRLIFMKSGDEIALSINSVKEIKKSYGSVDFNREYKPVYNETFRDYLINKLVVKSGKMLEHSICADPDITYSVFNKIIEIGNIDDMVVSDEYIEMICDDYKNSTGESGNASWSSQFPHDVLSRKFGIAPEMKDYRTQPYISSLAASIKDKIWYSQKLLDVLVNEFIKTEGTGYIAIFEMKQVAIRTDDPTNDLEAKLKEITKKIKELVTVLTNEKEFNLKYWRENPYLGFGVTINKFNQIENDTLNEQIERHKTKLPMPIDSIKKVYSNQEPKYNTTINDRREFTQYSPDSGSTNFKESISQTLKYNPPIKLYITGILKNGVFTYSYSDDDYIIDANPLLTYKSKPDPRNGDKYNHVIIPIELLILHRYRKVSEKVSEKAPSQKSERGRDTTKRSKK